LREEGRLKVFENRVLRRIFGPMRDKVTGEWRKLLNDLCCAPNIVGVIKSRRMRLAGNIARMGYRRVAYRVLVGKLEGRTPSAHVLTLIWEFRFHNRTNQQAEMCFSIL